MARRCLLASLLTLLALTLAQAADAGLKYPLHLGHRGQAVCDAQWLLAGHKPSQYRQPYFRVWKQPIRKDGRCLFDQRMARAVRGTKWRLGYCPAAKNKPCVITARFDYPLRFYLTGKIRRTNKMQRASFARRYPPKNCTVADTVVRLARAEVGNHEVPWGSNRGPRVSYYQSSTGAYGAAWCVSFAQKILQLAGIGPVANRSAGVAYVAEYARRRGWLRGNEIKKGYLVAWGSRHIGIIDSVVRKGRTLVGIYVIEGNASEQVMRRFYRYGYLGGWLIKVPGLDRRIRCA